MRYLMVLLCSTALTGCASTGQQHSSLWKKFSKKTESAEVETKVDSRSTLPEVDLAKEPGLTEQYRVGKFSFGTWLKFKKKSGQVFEKVTPQHSDAALVYIYRPDSRWNREEVLAPNFFLNGKRIPSLINNHYYWIEVPAGSYRLTTSHPLGALHFQKPKVLDFDVDAGGTYFIKYEEQGFRTGGSYEKPFYLMSEQLGLREIVTTKLKNPGISFVKQDQD